MELVAEVAANRLAWGFCGLLIVFGGAAGCSRRHYRLRADREAYDIIAEHANDPRWAAPGFTVELDPRSRYFDPYDPDHPPLPPDDPASHQLMRRVDGKRGWRHWYRDGLRHELENAGWRDRLGEYVELNENGEVKLSVESALRLAYMNSPTYQRQLETLYLSALDVSTERFRLDAQFFGGNDTTYTHQGRRRPGGERNTLQTDTDALVRRSLARGGELLVGFANSFVWQFTGPDTNFTSSVTNFSIVQPLLRGAGQDVALEQLTIVERALLANLRALQRYRQGFYTNVAIGQLGVTGPQRRGGFFGGTGLTGFTGTGAGGFGGVGQATGFGRGGFGGAGGAAAGGAGFAGGGAGQVGGFVGLLQQLQQIRNTQDSLNRQLRTLSLLEANLEAGVIDLTQVDQFRQNIESERANLLQAENNLENSLESFKTGTLGVPPDLPVQLDDSMIRQFQFVDPRANALEDDIADLQAALGKLPEQPDLEALQPVLDQAARLRRDVQQHAATVQQDMQRLEQQSGPRLRSMTPPEREQFERDKQQLKDSLADVRKRFAKAVAELAKLRQGLTPATRRQTTVGLVIWARDLLNLVREMTLIQARARLEVVTVEPVDLTADQAFQIALANRLDLMNNRAALVDTWRLIAFNADALQSVLDLTFSGDVQTTRNNPLSFAAPTGSLRVGLQFDAPFTRLVERNNYRQQLIQYQQDRRQLIQFEDGIQQTLLQLLRRLDQLRVNLEIQRRAMAIAIRRVDLTQEEFNRPVPPAQPGQPAAQFGPTAALNLLTALSDLRNTQNNFMSVWLNYYATRMLLLRELGIMALDDQGNWIDQPIGKADGYAEPCLPPAVPQQWWDLANPGPAADRPRLDPTSAGQVEQRLGPQRGPAAVPPLPEPPAARLIRLPPVASDQRRRDLFLWSADRS